MAPTVGVSRSEARVPENPRAVRNHGQPMQAQASRASGRSRSQIVVVMETQMSWNERWPRCPETGNISHRRAAGGAGLTTKPICNPAWPRVASNVRVLSTRAMTQNKRWRTWLCCGRGLEIPLSSRQVKDMRCVAFRGPKGCDNHRTRTSSQVTAPQGALTRNQPKTQRRVRHVE